MAYQLIRTRRIRRVRPDFPLRISGESRSIVIRQVSRLINYILIALVTIKGDTMSDRKNVCFLGSCDAGNGVELDTAGYCLDDDRYEIVLTEGPFHGRVLWRKDYFEDPIPVSDQSIIVRVLALQAEDTAIDAARDAEALALAERLHEGNPEAAQLLRAHLEFEDSLEVCPHEHEGVIFYQVGHNASHQFFFGMKDGQCYQYSSGDGGEDENGVWQLEEDFGPVDDMSGYCGHY